MTWLVENLATVIVTLVLAAVVTLIILNMRRDKAKGRSSCGGNCAGCAMCGACHRQNTGTVPQK